MEVSLAFFSSHRSSLVPKLLQLGPSLFWCFFINQIGPFDQKYKLTLLSQHRRYETYSLTRCGSSESYISRKMKPCLIRKIDLWYVFKSSYQIFGKTSCNNWLGKGNLKAKVHQQWHSVWGKSCFLHYFTHCFSLVSKFLVRHDAGMYPDSILHDPLTLFIYPPVGHLFFQITVHLPVKNISEKLYLSLECSFFWHLFELPLEAVYHGSTQVSAKIMLHCECPLFDWESDMLFGKVNKVRNFLTFFFGFYP